ncbi:MAG: phosphotransferase [Lachnospiraceae bacterium]|nr:phosphotransferase [Lachnospiraceae bacterium]
MKLLGKGNTAEVFEYVDGKICKLFYEGYPREYVELEFQNAKEMHNRKIRIPEPFQIVTIENRNGIIYEKIDGETLLNLMNANAENIEEYLDMFVNLHFDVISHHSKNVLSYKEYLTAMVKSRTGNDQIILDKINVLPDDDCILHGDFHPNNILIKEDGTPIVIDFMNVCYGPALYDVARTYFLINQFNTYLAERYLNKMNVLEGDIAEYVNIIELCRKYEG